MHQLHRQEDIAFCFSSVMDLHNVRVPDPGKSAALKRFVTWGLSDGQQYGPDLGTAPDGIAFDEAGNLWVTLPMPNTIGVITPDLTWEPIVEDPDATVMRLPTNICFGGPDRRTAYVGNLIGPSLPTFRVAAPGMALVHQM